MSSAAPLPDAGEPPNRALAAPSRGHERRRATEAERKALASVVRLRVLRLCLYEPLTNKEIAERLERNPASVLHHVRTLVAQGFLAADEVRPGPRGSREVPYRATGKSWHLDVGPDLGPSPRSPLLDTFLDEVSEVPPSEVRITRLGLQLSTEEQVEFEHELSSLLTRYARKSHDPGGKRLSLFLAIHPEPR